jgi:N-acetylneuraminic acid mutarotase
MSFRSIVPYEWFAIRSHCRSPQVRVGHSSTFVSSTSHVYIIGGANPSECFADVHRLSIPTKSSDTFTWTKCIGEAAALRRYEHAAVCSSDDAEKIVVFGGANTDCTFNDVHALNLTDETIEEWTPKDKSLVSARTHHSSCRIEKGLYIFSGGFQGAQAVDDNELYRFDLGTSHRRAVPMSRLSRSRLESRTWSLVDTLGVPPEQRHGHCLLTLGNARLYLHGGMNGRTFFRSIYSIDLNEKSARWNEHLSSAGIASPAARAAHGAVAVECTSSLVIFGGLGRNGQALNDTWSWSTNTEQWTEIVCRSLPRARLDFAYCLVELRDKERECSEATPCLFVHGGTDTQGEVFDDCFLLRLTFEFERDQQSNKESN